jgi:hypothetical protein
MPAEVTLLKLGRVEITCLPGEWLTGHLPGLVPKDPTGREAYVATIINGELQGYIATEEAMVNGWYEAGSALFDGPLSAAIVARAVHQLRNEIGVSVS